jgi:hypothetical protein
LFGAGGLIRAPWSSILFGAGGSISNLGHHFWWKWGVRSAHCGCQTYVERVVQHAILVAIFAGTQGEHLDLCHIDIFMQSERSCDNDNGGDAGTSSVFEITVCDSRQGKVGSNMVGKGKGSKGTWIHRFGGALLGILARRTLIGTVKTQRCML